MPTHVDNLRAWFDHGRATGADYMFVVHNILLNTDVPEYVTREIFHGVSLSLSENQELIVLEIYDLHDNREVQMWEHRAWHPPRAREDTE
jgi:hypothetical protein